MITKHFKILKMRIFISFLIVLFILAFLFPLSNKNKIIYIPFRKGETISDFSKKLKENGIIRFESFFKFLIKISGKDKNIKSGIYSFAYNEGEILAFLKVLNQKPKPLEIKITIYEGLNSFQIAKLLKENLKIDEKRFINLVNDSLFINELSEKFEKLKNLKSLEGFLFPETYVFFEGEDEKFIIEKLVQTFFEKIKPFDSLFNSSKLKFYDVIILASIVEKEALYEDEKPLIASVYLNRLKRNMPLQANPTLAYVLRANTYWLNEEALKYNSPYNTYLYLGLPPTPICSPSLSSILAVLNSRETNYLFFVANKDGRHLFSRTYEEHIRNIKKVKK
jgi:UPF0755 protein